METIDEKAVHAFNAGCGSTFVRYISSLRGDYTDEATSILEQLEETATDWPVSARQCDSPIEQIMLARLAFLFDGRSHACLDILGSHSKCRALSGVFVAAQSPIKQYRADICVTVRYGDDTHRFVVECDGHDYHERTKEQAARDRSRDRAMVAEGITVLRFTGSEIVRDSVSCAAEVEAVVQKYVAGLS